MIGTFGLADDTSTKFFGFAEDQWQVWTKPPHAKFISIFAVGGGGGGGGGASNTASSVKTGGNGGASSACINMVYPAFALPSKLYVNIGRGGQGGIGASSSVASNGSPGTDGELTYVSLTNSTASSYLVAVSGNSMVSSLGSGGQFNGTIPAASTAGTVASLFLLFSAASYNTRAGQAGGTSTTAGVPTAIASSASPFSAGAGGGGTSTTTAFAGGANNALSTHGLGEGIDLTGGLAGGGAGQSGFYSNPNLLSINRYRMFGAGGSGGGANNTGRGGNGGDGYYGCGGGGGGAGLVAVGGGGGNGGKGGDGLVIITAW